MTEDDRDHSWIFKIPKISIWWLVLAAMLGGFIYYQYIHVKNSEHAEQKKYAMLERSRNNLLENGSGVQQLSQIAKTISKSSGDIFRTPKVPNNTK
ncbi:MAG: hypothetical protein ACYCQM_13855 [Acidithiobacillus sp.]